MKIASLVFFVMLAIMALLGSVLLDQSAQTERELAQVKQELTQLKQTPASQPPQVLPKAEPLVQRVEKDKKAGLRKQDLLKEGVRLTALEESLKLEKLQIQKTQLQIDAEKQQLDTDEKSLDLEMLTAVLENRLQKRLNTLVAATTATATPVQSQSNAPVKGVDQYGELPMNNIRLTVFQLAMAACLWPGQTALAVPIDVKADFYFGPDMSRNQACDNAREAAKVKALALMAGENIASDQSMHCVQSAHTAREQRCDMQRNAWVLVEGRIRKSEIISETVKTVQGAQLCTVSMVVDVLPPAIDAYPGFNLRLELNRSSFRAGDALVINLTPATPMFVSVFNWRPAFSRDNVVRLFPNEIEKNNFIRNAVRLPSASAEKNYSFELEWLAPAGEDKDSMSEWVIVVATKKPMPWLAVYDMQRFKEKLLEIPADQRRVVHRPYLLMR